MSEDREPGTEDVPSGPRVPTGTVIRDVVVFQFKLIVDGVRDFVMVPVSLVAAGLDVLDRGHRPGYHFYRVVRFGRATERFIHLFESADRVEPREPEGFGLEGRSLDELIESAEQRFGEELAEDDAARRRLVERLERALKRLRRGRSDPPDG